MKDELIKELKLSGVDEKEAGELFIISRKLSKFSEIKLSDDYKSALLEKFKGKKFPKKSWFSHPVLFAPILVLFLFLLIGYTTVVSAQKSLPGDPLYPVKRLSENVVVKLDPNFKDEIIKRRSNEVKNLINEKKDSEVLDKAIEDYREAIENHKEKDDIKKDSEDESSKEIKKNIWEKGDMEIERAIEKVENRREKLKDKEDEKVKGEKTENREVNEMEKDENKDSKD